MRTILYKNIEDQIWCEMFPKFTNNSIFERGNLPNESLDQENLQKCGSKLRTAEPRPTFTGSYKKECILDILNWFIGMLDQDHL